MPRIIPAEGPLTAKVMIVGEAPGDKEVLFGKPFAGPSGFQLNELLTEVGLRRDEIYVTNVCKIRPPDNDIGLWIAKTKKEQTPEHSLIDGKWVRPELRGGRIELQREIEVVRPNCIIAMGNVALWACTGQWGIGDWRGSLEQCHLVDFPCKVIPTYHPAAILRQYELRSIALHDLRRVVREMDSPIIPPLKEIFTIQPDFEEVMEILDWLKHCCNVNDLTKFAFDIETMAGHIDCIGIAWSPFNAICIPFMCEDGHYWSEDEEVKIMYQLYELMNHPNFYGIAQNGLYDIQYLLEKWLLLPLMKADTMTTHHTLMPTGKSGEDSAKRGGRRSSFKKDLGFLSSIYRKDHRYWKNQLEESMEDD